MAFRTIQYQAANAKWYELEVWDIMDPLDNSEAENKTLCDRIKELEDKLETAEINWRELRQLDLDNAKEIKRMTELYRNLSAQWNGGIHKHKLEGSEAANTLLREFAHQVIKEHCWGIEMDGLEIQDLAEKLGLVAKHTVTEDDVYEESDFEVGDIIYKFTKALKGGKPEEKKKNI